MIFKESVLIKPRFSFFATCIVVVLSTAQILAQNLPAGFSRVFVTAGLSNPTAMAFASDGRIFVCLQGGSLRVIKNNALLATPFTTLSVNASGERGLIGIALDPDFSTNGYIYLYYTLASGARNRISRFTANGDVALAASELVILDLDLLSGATNHNGGAMHFGKDGKLYIAIGENANTSHAQNLDTYHGKILRINPDGSIPEGNPFTTGSAQKMRVWAYGLRNPFTIDFETGTGKFYVNDVGQVTWEEINDATTGGRNFGWPTNEGIVTVTSFTNPVYAYAHGTGDGIGCALTGGVFFNPTSTTYPVQYYGKYFFMDLCGAWINYITPQSGATRSSFATAIGGQALGLDLGIDGNLYYLSRTNSALYKVVYSSSQQPVITDQPDAQELFLGQAATFAVSASGALPLQYQWKKNGENIIGQTSYQLHIPSISNGDVGQYSVQITNSFGNITSSEVLLKINGVNLEPNPFIASPLEGSLYRAGDVISFSGSATDPEDGTLPVASLSWQVDFHHATHVHDSPPVSGVAAGSFTIPTMGETSDDVFYRLSLTAQDGGGRTSTISRDILPYKSQITLTSMPPGLAITLDGQQTQTPKAVMSVEGIERTIGVGSLQQEKEGKLYEFDHWQHGGELSQTIPTPVEDVIFTAIFREITFGPIITDQPDAQEVTQGGSATFNVVASGSQPFQYQWKKNGIDITGQTTAELKIITVKSGDVGRYSVVVKNNFGNVQSNDALLRLAGVNHSPVPIITSPAEGSRYTAGTMLQYSGSASDPEDGTLPASALSWRIVLYHHDEPYEDVSFIERSGGEFRIPTNSEFKDSVWYRLYLTAKDSQGQSATLHRDVFPNTSQVSLTSSPEGLIITLNQQSVKTPHNFLSVEGIRHEIKVEGLQVLEEKTYQFERWEHGGEASQIFSVPETDEIYVAIFTEVPVTSSESNHEQKLSVYPNPIQHFMILENVPVSEINIIDLAGKIIQTISVPDRMPRLTLQVNLNPGIYFLKIIGDKTSIVKKLLVSDKN